jgi:hypothetical protein
MGNFEDRYGILRLAATLENKSSESGKPTLSKAILHFFIKAKVLLKYIKAMGSNSS